MTDLEVIISLLSVLVVVESTRLVFAVVSRVRKWLQGRSAHGSNTK